MSGAGRIKADGSNDEEVIEVKSATRSFRLTLDDVKTLHRQSTREGKTPVMVVRYDDGYEAVIEVRRY